MSPFINPAVHCMSPFIVMEVLEKAKAMEAQGISVIHLEVGEPDFELPECVADATHMAVSNGHTHYTHSLGDIELRKAICKLYKDEYNVDVDPECIVITSGSSAAILLALMTVCGANDEVILSNPGYACYGNFVLACNAVPTYVPVSDTNGFQFNISDIQKSIRTYPSHHR